MSLNEALPQRRQLSPARMPALTPVQILSLNEALPQRRQSSPARIPVSTPLPEDIPQTLSLVDGDLTVVPSIAKETTALEECDAEPDWKITIENTDGSISEVNLRQKQIRISMIVDKPKTPEKSIVSISEKEVTESAPEAEKADHLKEPVDPRKQRIWIIGRHALTASSSIIIIAIMIVSLVNFYKYANVHGAFPENPILSPTIVMVSIACLNFAADMTTLGMHFCHGKTVASAGRMVQHIQSMLSIIQAIGGATSAGYFKSAKSLAGGADIWGFCCSDAATANFADMLCQSNTAAWALNVLQVTLHALSLAIAIWTLFKPGIDLKTTTEEAKALLGQDDVEDNEEDNSAEGK